MKLSAITDEIAQDFSHALDVLCEYSVRHAELRGLWDTNIADLTAEQVAKAKEELKSRGMTVSCLSTPFYKCDLDIDEAAIRGRMHLAKARSLAEQLEMLRRCCALAHEFGADLIRVFTFWKKGELTPAIERRIADAFDKPIQIAEEEGVTLALENEHACYIGTGAEAGRILSKLGSPRIRACWDPGNAYVAGERPYPNGYNAVRPFAAHVHVKDALVSEDGKSHAWCVVGEGDIDYSGQFEALRKDGYTGFISLETHYIPPGGTPEEGSRACLASLRRFIKE